ncbi:MAG: zf-HC2 domain-containing protein [candidate division WOR-3 bacterium]|nr:zf-HC2 domain-containing protein [candidate division WOR-3 bacterium]
MMKHSEIEILMHKKLDGEIDEYENEILIQHLRVCPECQRYFNELVRVCEEIFGLNEFFPGIDFNNRVLSAIGIRKRKYWYKLIPVFGLLYLAGIAFIVFTPFLNLVFSRIIISIPGVLNILDKVKPFGIWLFNILSAFLHFNGGRILYSFIMVMILFYFFGKLLTKKEVLCHQ